MPSSLSFLPATWNSPASSPSNSPTFSTLARDLELAYELRGDIARARTLVRDRELTRAHALAYSTARTLELARAGELPLGHALDRSRALVRRLERVSTWLAVAKAITAGTTSQAAAPRDPGTGPRPSYVALHVNRWTARLLSAGARVLYGDELLDEMYDLADQRASRRAQVACALRQLARVRQLRVAARAAAGARMAAGTAAGE